jgi:Flp pilus assembly protein TadB
MTLTKRYLEGDGIQRSRRIEESAMARRWQLAAVGIALAIILWILNVPVIVPILIIVAAIAVPVVGWYMLDSNQRARIRRMRARKQLP